MRLHTAKTAAYRDAWKKRGEVIGVMANIARKVDRLEYVSAGAAATEDESFADTVLDLFVYAVKYLTFLADRDAAIAGRLYGDTSVLPPYSDGTAGFDGLVRQIDFSPHDSPVSTIPAAVQAVTATFSELEQCFTFGRLAPIERRFRLGQHLVRDAVELLDVVNRDALAQLTLALRPYSSDKHP
ncbi:hypothetical protein [Nocardia sp. BMG51109]|uniref:hypothetical protein n=1 Tax=Nocardia sp. BMG51109 TaxID=1056816 RepID=UPI0012EBC20C|nr:hypothetical protein [Nocardia sp. BMG51109]